MSIVFTILRVVILIILAGLFVLVIKKGKFKHRASYAFSIAGLIVMGMAVWYIPFEAPALRFDSMEEAFLYTYPGSTIYLSSECEGGGVIEAYVPHENFLFTPIYRDENGWITPGKQRVVRTKYIFLENGREIKMIEMENSGLTYINVVTPFYPNRQDAGHTISSKPPTDNQNTKFERDEYEWSNVFYITDHAYVDVRDKDYRLIVDDKEIDVNRYPYGGSREDFLAESTGN